MIEQTESPKPQSKNKLKKWLIRLPLIFLASFLLYATMMIMSGVGLFPDPPIVVNRTHFAYILSSVNSHVASGIIEMERGVQIENNPDTISIIDKEEFVSGLLEVIKERNMKKIFDAGILRIFVQDNFCFIRVDINAASRHRSHLRIDLRDAIARIAAARSRRTFGFFEDDDAFDRYLSEPGPKLHTFFGNFDMNSPVVFTEDMNYFYLLIFVFNNDPPVSISEFP